MDSVINTLKTIYSYFLFFYSTIESAWYFYCVYFFFFVLSTIIFIEFSLSYFHKHMIRRTPSFLWYLVRAILLGYIIFIIFAYFEFKPYDEEIIISEIEINHFSDKFPIVNCLAPLIVYIFAFSFYLFFYFNYVYDLLIDYFQQNYEIIIFFSHIFFFFFLFFFFDILLDYYSVIVDDFLLLISDSELGGHQKYNISVNKIVPIIKSSSN